MGKMNKIHITFFFTSKFQDVWIVLLLHHQKVSNKGGVYIVILLCAVTIVPISKAFAHFYPYTLLPLCSCSRKYLDGWKIYCCFILFYYKYLTQSLYPILLYYVIKVHLQIYMHSPLLGGSLHLKHTEQLSKGIMTFLAGSLYQPGRLLQLSGFIVLLIL